MKATFSFVTVVLFSFTSIGQIGSNDCRKSTPVFEVAEKMPEPTGGMDSLKSFFQKEINSWGIPNLTRQFDLTLLINSDGSACPYLIYVALNSLPTEKLMRSIKEMPKWEPAIQNNFKVDCYMKLNLKIEEGVLTRLIYKNIN